MLLSLRLVWVRGPPGLLILLFLTTCFPAGAHVPLQNSLPALHHKEAFHDL